MDQVLVTRQLANYSKIFKSRVLSQFSELSIFRKGKFESGAILKYVIIIDGFH